MAQNLVKYLSDMLIGLAMPCKRVGSQIRFPNVSNSQTRVFQMRPELRRPLPCSLHKPIKTVPATSGLFRGESNHQPAVFQKPLKPSVKNPSTFIITLVSNGGRGT